MAATDNFGFFSNTIALSNKSQVPRDDGAIALVLWLGIIEDLRTALEKAPLSETALRQLFGGLVFGFLEPR